MRLFFRLFYFCLFIFLSSIYPKHAYANWVKQQNPVLDLGSSGSWDDAGLGSNSIYYNGNQFDIWYEGYDGQNLRIGQASSTDGKIWNKSSNYVIDILADSNNQHVHNPHVLVNNNNYQMWYAASSISFNNIHINHTTSSDGLAWSSSTVGILTASLSWETGGLGISFPRLIASNNQYQMWYAANGNLNGQVRWRIGYATSNDGINWTKYPTPVLESVGGWEGADVANPQVFFENGQYHMFYHGDFGIGHATSSDGINWTRDLSNPIVTPGPSSYDSVRVLNPFVMNVNGVYYMYYAASGNDGKSRIGLAINDEALPVPETSPTPTVTPTPLPAGDGPIVIAVGMGASWNADDVFSCNINQSNIWTLTPFVSTYQRLLDTLAQNAGLILGDTLFLYTYDWRQTLPAQQTKFQDFVQNTVLAGKPAGTKVKLVAHSFGGLVSRSYLSENPDPDDHDIEQLLTVGTPHQGTVEAYPAWENGTFFDDNLFRRLLYHQIIRHCQDGGETKRAVVADMIPSMQQLLPVFDYLKRNNQLVDTDTLFYQNDWISAHPIPDNHYDIPFQTLSGDGVRTIRFLDVVDPNKKDQKAGNWQDGKPRGKEKITEGDGAVLHLSSRLDIAGITNTTITGNHEKILSTDEGLNAILEFLGVSQTNLAAIPLQQDLTSTSVLSVITNKEADVTVEEPDKRTRKGDKQMNTVFDPKDGKYSITIIPKQDEQITVQIAMMHTDDEEPQIESRSFRSQKGKTKSFTIDYSPTKSPKLKVSN